MGCGDSRVVDVPTQDMGKKASKQSPREIEDGAADEDIPVPPSTPPHPLNLRDMLCIGLKRFCDVIDETKFSEEAVRKFVEINEEAIEQVRFTNREIIYQKGCGVRASLIFGTYFSYHKVIWIAATVYGSQPNGLHIVAQGEASILSEHKLPGKSDCIELMRVPYKDFFCDVETVYGMPCSTSVRSFEDSVVYVIPPDCVQQLFVKENVKKPDVATWYVRRRYPPNIPNINHKQVYERICMSVMKQVTLFSKWSDAVLESFLEYMPEKPIILYPTGANIIQAGDKAEYMLLLVKGRLRLASKAGVTVGFVHQHYRHTRVFAEEGVFCDGWQHHLSVIADTPCHVLQVETDWLWHASNNIWEFAEGAEPYWYNAVRKWEKIHSLGRKGEMYDLNSTYGPYLQIEVQYHWLRSNDSFASCPPGFVYEVAKCGRGMLLKKDKFFSYQDLAKGCILVLKGELHLITKEDLQDPENTYETALKIFSSQSLIYYKDMAEDNLFLFAHKDSLTVKFSKQDLIDELRNHPGTYLDFMEDSMNKI